MGQKVNPIGFRISVTKNWRSRWFADTKDFGNLLHEDLRIRDMVKTRLKDAAVPDILIERYANRALNCMYILNEIFNKENINYNILIGNKKIQNRLGIRKRIPLDTKEDWWNRITVKQSVNQKTGELSSMML